jgi:hypothetical protein
VSGEWFLGTDELIRFVDVLVARCASDEWPTRVRAMIDPEIFSKRKTGRTTVSEASKAQ